VSITWEEGQELVTEVTNFMGLIPSALDIESRRAEIRCGILALLRRDSAPERNAGCDRRHKNAPMHSC